MFNNLDTNKDGELNLNEFSKLANIIKKDCQENVYKPVYDLLDSNKNGSIDK